MITWRHAISFRSRCTLPVQLDFRVVRRTEHGDKHANAVQRRYRNGEEDNAEEDGEALLEVAADRDCQGACDLVCLERDDVERESHEAVAQDGEEEGGVECAFRHCSLESGELAARVGVEEALCCGERTSIADSARDPVINRLVATVLIAARITPRNVRRKPIIVK
jgi:hypothetical protein